MMDPETTLTQQVTKQKDPKKVAAGRAGAAARKERKLVKLREAKANILTIPDVDTTADATAVVPSQHTTAVETYTAQSWVPFIAGGLVLVGAVWVTQRPAKAQLDAPRPPPIKVIDKQLDIRRDPLHME